MSDSAHANQPSDFLQRQQALDPTRSFAVSAPAGSGKTGLLTQRVLTLLAHCEQPEELLAITFTRKAAAEMRQRIMSALHTAAHEPMPQEAYSQQTWKLARQVLERDQKNNWQLLAAPNHLSIQTIDGLCRNLARQLVLENGLGELPQPADDSTDNYRQAVHQLLSQLESNTPYSDALCILLKHLDNNLTRVESLLTDLLSKREQWLDLLMAARSDHARDYLEQQLAEVIEDNLAVAAEKLQPISSELMLLVDYAARNLTEAHSDHPLCQLQGATELPEADSGSASVWQALIEILLTKDGTWRKTIDVRTGFPAGKGEPQVWKSRWKSTLETCQQIPGLLDTLVALRYLPYCHYPNRQWQLLQALTTLLPRLTAELSLQFLASGRCDFTEVTLAALTALGDESAPTDTALKLDYRLRHILIDEFQDTSTVQFQLLRKLTAGWQVGDGRTLFIVGDGMQSLYGFRSANVGLFLEARQHPIGDIELTPLDLTVNFRSQHQVVEWVNQTFSRAFPEEEDISRGAVSYGMAEAFNPALDNQAVEVDLFVDHMDRQAEAERVVQAVRKAKLDTPDGTTAILVRNRNHLKAIIPHLYQAGLNWQAIDIEPLGNKMAVIDCHSLTRALLDPSDRIAWLAILRAPWCGLNLADLHALATTDLSEVNPKGNKEHFPFIWGQLRQYREIATISEAGQAILNRVVTTLEQALSQQGRKPLRSWIEGTWIGLGGAAALLNHHDIAHVRRYFDLLEQHSNEADIADWTLFEAAVNRLYATPSSDSNPQLQVMTIHKSKGLEFDTVIVPGLDISPRSQDSRMLMWRERLDRNGEPQLLLSPLQATDENNDALLEHLKYEQKLKDRLENTRVIYVAATRAIKKLHLLGHVKTDRKQAISPPSADSLLAPLWPTLAARIEQNDATINCHSAPDDTKEYTEAEQPASLVHIARLPSDWQLPDIKHNAPLKRYRGRAEGYQSELETSYRIDNSDARHIGTVLHRTLQQMVTDTPKHWTPERVKRQHPFWRAQLLQLGVLDVDSAVSKLERAVQQISKDPDGIWLLDNSHLQSRCELPIYHRHGGKTRKSVLDRTFISDGIRWIIDYKSSEPAPGVTLNSFIQQEIELYRPQLQRYSEQFRQLECNPVKAALYFPLLPQLLIVD